MATSWCPGGTWGFSRCQRRVAGQGVAASGGHADSSPGAACLCPPLPGVLVPGCPQESGRACCWLYLNQHFPLQRLSQPRTLLQNAFFIAKESRSLGGAVAPEEVRLLPTWPHRSPPEPALQYSCGARPTVLTHSALLPADSRSSDLRASGLWRKHRKASVLFRGKLVKSNGGGPSPDSGCRVTTWCPPGHRPCSAPTGKQGHGPERKSRPRQRGSHRRGIWTSERPTCCCWLLPSRPRECGLDTGSPDPSCADGEWVCPYSA